MKAVLAPFWQTRFATTARRNGLVKHSGNFDNQTKARLQKEKRSIAEAYGAVELGQCMQGVSKNATYCLPTFDMEIVKQQWGKLLVNQTAHSPPSLGLHGAPCAGKANAHIEALQLLFRHFARDWLFVSGLPTAVVLGELEMCLNHGMIPTGGLTFDCQHAAMLTKVNVFITYDTRLANNARRAAAKIEAAGSWRVQIVQDENGLASALR